MVSGTCRIPSWLREGIRRRQDRASAHRRADLSYGFVETCGLRCNYHGWGYDASGQCVEMPYEDTVAPQARYKDKIKILAYPMQVHAGLIWAYMGQVPIFICVV
jgi:5,5'-dehydrodivanillate O-demethylase